MGYTLYDNKKWFGSIAPLSGMQKAIDKYNAQKGKVRIATLTSLFKGKAENPKKAISDIGKLLASAIDCPPFSRFQFQASQDVACQSQGRGHHDTRRRTCGV